MREEQLLVEAAIGAPSVTWCSVEVTPRQAGDGLRLFGSRFLAAAIYGSKNDFSTVCSEATKPTPAWLLPHRFWLSVLRFARRGAFPMETGDANHEQPF